MGADFSTYVVCGVPFDELITFGERKETVTRYNEVTGSPYEKTLIHTVTFIGTELTDDWEAAIRTVGLERFSENEEATERDIIGFQVARSSEYKPVNEIPYSADFQQSVLERFRRLGYRGDIRLFLILHCSY